MTRCLLALIVLLAAMAGCGDPARTVSLNAYRNAVATGTADELAARGMRLHDRPHCRTPGAQHASVDSGFTVRCTTSTVDGLPVLVLGSVGAVGTSEQTEHYEIRVGERVVLRAPCLGRHCPRS